MSCEEGKVCELKKSTIEALNQRIRVSGLAEYIVLYADKIKEIIEAECGCCKKDPIFFLKEKI